MGKTKSIKDAAEAELQRAYSYSSNHRTELVKDQKCGCFFCMEIFSPSEIKEWCLETEDA